MGKLSSFLLGLVAGLLTALLIGAAIVAANVDFTVEQAAARPALFQPFVA